MDRGYDSDGLRKQLRRLGIEPSPASQGSAQTADARRSSLAALQTALDHRAHVRLAGQLPAANLCATTAR
jgi:hypothetical protein